MKKIKYFFKLVRWQNLIMVALMMFLVYYALMSPLFMTSYSTVVPDSLSFFLFVLSVIFVVAGGYVINDCFDVDIDKINRPDTVIVDRVLPKSTAYVYYWILNILGLCCSVVSGVRALKMSFFQLVVCVVLLALVLYLYSRTYKRKLLIGNIIVALSVASAVALPLFFEMIYLSQDALILSVVKDVMPYIEYNVLIYTAFAFLSTLVRELIKDAEDYKGDMQDNCRTLPVVAGLTVTKVMICVLIILLLALVAYFQYVLYSMDNNVALLSLIVVDILCVALIMQVLNAEKKKDFHRASLMAKILMLFGIISMIFV